MHSFHFKNFQKEDIARAAMKDAALIAWEPGMGKTLAIFAWPLLKEARRVLIVAPESLHLQIRDTGREFFGVTVRPLPHQDAFHRWKLGRPAVNTQPRFYLTSYHQLGLNGADEWHSEKPSALIQARRLANGLPRLHWNGLGFEADDIRCVFAPTLSSLAHNADTFDCVVVDEGTRLQGDDSLIAAGVRRLNPRYRLVLSATPIKNRLTSVFWLVDWVAQGLSPEEGKNSAWPYPSTVAGKRTFAQDHLERDKHVTRAQETGKKPTWRQTPRITNQHHLWRILAPFVIRRRKADCGVQIVPKFIKPIWVQPGKAQLQSYLHAVQNPPDLTQGGRLPSPMSQAVMQLGILRQIVLCPDSPNLTHRTSPFTPKMAALATLVKQCRAAGEQVVIGSTFQHFATTLNQLLRKQGHRVVLLDGRVDAIKRAELSAAFKRGEFDVLIGGVSSMGEGHSWECCPNLILPSLEWSYDLNEQFINRVWRINSPKPVTIYLVLIRGTVDERLYHLFKEKDDASRLTLDGEFNDQPQDETDFEEFVASLSTGQPHLTGVDEAQIEAALSK